MATMTMTTWCWKQQETINQRSCWNNAMQCSGGINFMQHTAKVASAVLQLLEWINESFVQWEATISQQPLQRNWHYIFIRHAAASTITAIKNIQNTVDAKAASGRGGDSSSMAATARANLFLKGSNQQPAVIVWQQWQHGEDHHAANVRRQQGTSSRSIGKSSEVRKKEQSTGS